MQFEIDADIPYGNAADVGVSEDNGVTRVEFAADPHGGPECLWFCLRLRRLAPATRPDQQIELVMKHFRNILGCSDPTKLRPVMRRDEGDWERLGPASPLPLPDGRVWAAWTIEAPSQTADIALCYPYGPAQLDQLLAETNDYWQADAIGVSQGGRAILRLSNDYGEEQGERPGLYLVARQHSGEMPGSWVLDGFLRGLALDPDRAPLTWAAPLANIDGVVQGDYGKDNFPYDLNRAWGQPPMRHETLVLQRDMQLWRSRCKPCLALDFHAPGGCEFEGVYCFLPDPDTMPEEHQRAVDWEGCFAVALGTDYAAAKFGRVARYGTRWKTPGFTGYAGAVLGAAALTFETPYAEVGDLVLTRERYREIGARLAGAVIDRLAGTA